MQGDGDRFEKRSLLEGQIGRKAMNDPGGNRDKFRKGPGAAVVAAGDAENFAAIQTLSTALSLSLARTHLRATEAGDICDRRLLWRFGISGDLPIVLVSAGAEQGLGRPLFRAVPFPELAPKLERVLRTYLGHRRGSEESFRAFSQRHSIEELTRLLDAAA